MFSEDQQPFLQQDHDATIKQKGLGPGKYLKEKPRINVTDETTTDAIQQNCSQEIAEDSEDDFNYDDLIIAELVDKDRDKELDIHRRSPNDKAVEFDITSTKTRTEGGTKGTKEHYHCTNNYKQLSFTPAWSVEECESDILEIHKETTRTLYRGDTSSHQNTETQETEVASEGEEETTPVYNRFQSLGGRGATSP
ncbi:hypothetical protein Salat_2133100 [Sesamum alatum]|uniref:Uncharacterized protein n=1 Tax=Sesamum alatum TaxID=300844 RepID=A0AAE1Y158_9LAMI|nr:hypothetical protein Salat_2133100 [Sesamum alatum]